MCRSNTFARWTGRSWTRSKTSNIPQPRSAIELDMMNRVLAAVCFASLAASAQAHHSAAMFDAGKNETLLGTVKNVDWINPHVSIEIVAMDAAGQPGRWQIE